MGTFVDVAAGFFLTALVGLNFGGVGAKEPGLVGRDVSSVCGTIASEISSVSDVYYPLEYQYYEDDFHYISSSSQTSTCSVEPGSVEDVGIILQILGNTQTSFGVKGGGHASNPGFSSTPGVQISMTKFDGVTYDADTQTATIGTGLVWDDVYQVLESYGVNVVGGRVSGVGVAGFALGGGYSFLSNQYGLTVDTIVAWELVLPNGTATNVTEASNPDLFFGLKGGFNNFGIVTSFTMQTFPQGDVWGGIIVTAGTEAEVITATANFYANVTDPKAAIITTFDYDLLVTVCEINIFYDGPTAPDGIFDEFIAIPYLVQDLSTRSFLSLITGTPDNVTQTERGFFHTVSLLNITESIVEAIWNETTFWIDTLVLDVPGLFISYDVEPFLPSVFSHGASGSSAWPPDRSVALLPLNIYFAWWDSDSDALIAQTMQESADYLTSLAVAEGQAVADVSLYPNYAIYETTVERIYAGNLERLQEIKAEYDPDNVMGLAGGWKFSVAS